MMSRLMIAVAFATVFACHAEARNPISRYRGNMSQSNTSSYTPSRQSAPSSRPMSAASVHSSTVNTASTAVQNVQQSDEKMTEIYGPSILVRQGN